MAMSEKFKALGVDQQRLLIGKVKKLYDAGITAEMISEGLNKDLDLIKETIEMIERANKFKEEHELRV